MSPAQRPRKGRSEKHYARHKTVEDVVSSLTSGSGCGALIVGEHGSGKSFIAQRALEQLGDDYLVVQVRGSSISSKLPYGALSVLLNDLDASHLEHPLMVLRGLTQLLHTRSQGRKVVLFVDNAHDLDELSTMMVAQLCAGGHVLLLAACVDLPNLGSDIMGLWKDDLLRRVDLGPFDFRETADSLAQEYGGHFSHTAARALWNASGGNALFLHSLAREQIKRGTIVRHEDSWVLGDKPVALAGEIRDVLKARLNRLSPGQRDVFELLSLAGALPLQTLMTVSRAQDIDTLQERALIRVSQDHPPMVSITNPVTAVIVASVVPPGRSAELRRRLGAVLQDQELDEFTGSTAVAWALDCGEEVAPRLALAAARLANKASDPQSALRFARQIEGGEKPAEVAVESARAFIALHNDDAARRILAEVEQRAGDGLALDEWASLQLLWAELDRRIPAAPASALARLQEIELRLTVSGDAGAEPGSVAERVHLAYAELAGFEGRYADVLQMFEDADPTDLGSESKIIAASLLCEAKAVTGDVLGAVGLGRQVVLAAGTLDLSDASIREIRGRFLLALLLSAKFREAADFLARTSESLDQQARLGGMFEIGQGIVDLHRGQLTGAIQRLQSGVRQLRLHDPDAVAGLAAAACAYAFALQGDEDKAGALLVEVEEPQPRASWLVNRITRYFELSAKAEIGQKTEALRALKLEADTDTDASALSTGLQFLSAAARLGDRQATQKLSDLADQVSGHFAGLCSRLAEGLADADSEELLATSKDADAAGHAVFARDVTRKAVSCANDAGNRISLRMAQRTQQSLEDRFGNPRNGVISLLTSTLTARESEVAVRAAAGTSNRKIADEMHVSVRTVEGHLYQVYAKLHVASRSELKDVISGPVEHARLG
ncbi:MAG TPA: LuxR C-terminal-related transcriptional regulator [Arthrobacter sp.]|nr:LuxR C-terminal-related transcriptional regulator [Arthrobacter sp.]